MSKIKQLSSHLADLIAAGEVVERPGSVVKELTENAIDAGATTVTVEIQNGGITFLRVTDNGCGMSSEDAEIAFLRHATSKIATEDDLGNIHTLGFRGEALAAISSVSRIDLLTREPAAVAGTSLHLDAGVITERAPAGCPAGTTILVRDLFYNTPARMKFLKRDTAEGANVFAVVQRQALAHPEVAFRFFKDGEEALSTPGDGKLESAIYAVLGRQTALDMVPVDNTWEQVHVTGFVTKPTAARGSRSYQHFFVNGRYIKSKALTAALEEAYRNQIMVGRFPACVLQITVPTDTVDVNVHPAKTEVKFLAERTVFDTVHYGVLATLNRTPGRPEAQLKPPSPKSAAPRPDFFQAMGTEQFRKFADTVQQVPPAPRATPFSPIPVRYSEHSTPIVADSHRAVPYPAATPTPPASTVSTFAQSTPIPIETAPTVPVTAPEPTILLPAELEVPVQAEIPLAEISYRVVGEVLNTYIIVEQGDDVLLIDKHAAHERINFEKLKAQKHAIMSQVLMAPIAANLDREEAALLLSKATLLRDFGYEIEDFGDGSVLIRQIPADIDAEDAEESLIELAAIFSASRNPDPMSLRDDLLHTIACKAAIKGGWHTEPRERDALVHAVMTRDDIKYCPHGRPVCITLTKSQLERQFKRA